LKKKLKELEEKNYEHEQEINMLRLERDT